MDKKGHRSDHSVLANFVHIRIANNYPVPANSSISAADSEPEEMRAPDFDEVDAYVAIEVANMVALQYYGTHDTRDNGTSSEHWHYVHI